MTGPEEWPGLVEHRMGAQDAAVTNVMSGSVDGNVVQIGHTEHVTILSGGAGGYSLDEFHPPSPFDRTWSRHQPSRLLDARREIVPFTGRKEELELLAKWRDASATTSFMLGYGSGGEGKTRLASRFAALSRAANWEVWHARPVPIGGTRSKASLRSHRTLIVVDYADRWPPNDLHMLFADCAGVDDGQVRVLLLARTVGWWAAERGEIDELNAPADEFRLRGLLTRHDERLRAFEWARDRYVRPDIYDLDPTSVPAPGSLAGPGFDSLLAVHMAALVAVDATHRGLPTPTGSHHLSAYLLDRERMNWARLYGGGRAGNEFATPPSVMARVAFTAALVGGTDHRTSADLLRELDLEVHPGRALTDHAACYPAADPALCLEPLYPDRLAEDFLALMLPGHQVEAYAADPWAAAAVSTVLAPSRAPDHLRRAITFLAAATERWAHVGPGHLYPALRESPASTMAAGSSAMVTLATAAHVDVEVLAAVEPLLPDGSHRALAVGASAVIERLTQHRLASATNQAERAHLNSSLGYRMLCASQYEEALAPIETAVADYRALTTSAPARGSRRGLAMNLANLGVALSALGRPRAALSAIDEATTLYQKLVLGSSDQTLELGRTVNVRSRLLAALGAREEALAAAHEAVGLLDDDTDQTPLRRRLLAAARLSLACRLKEVGRMSEARTVMATAQATARAEEAAAPEEMGLDLARSLSSAALLADEHAQRVEALNLATEAVRLHRIQAAAVPELDMDALPDALVNLGRVQFNHDQPEAALASTQEAIDLYRRLAARWPRAHEQNLTKAIANSANILSRLGRHGQALNASAEAVERLRRLTTIDPDAHTEDLACALSGLIANACAVGADRQALMAAEEAVAILTRTNHHRRETREPLLAIALTNLGTAQAHVGKLRAATKTGRQAAELYKELAQREPTVYEGNYAVALLNLALWDATRGRFSQAREGSAQALHIVERRMANEQATRDELAFALCSFAQVRAEGRLETMEGLLAAIRAMDIYAALEENCPGAFTEELTTIRAVRRTLETRLYT